MLLALQALDTLEIEEAQALHQALSGLPCAFDAARRATIWCSCL
jgi:hypothetical protein